MTSNPIAIVHRSQHVVVVDKPADWLSVPSRIGLADPRPVVGTVLQAQLGCRVWPTHRLDEEVSGLLMFALSAHAHRRISMALEEHRIEKTYAARCEGTPPSDATFGAWVRWTSTLLRGKRRAYLHPAGKVAITDVRLRAVGAGPGGDLEFDLRPRTGRGHQLRVELARRGCPILGDTLYGAVRPRMGPGIALRAVALSFAGWPEAAALDLPAALVVEPSLTAGGLLGSVAQV